MYATKYVTRARARVCIYVPEDSCAQVERRFEPSQAVVVHLQFGVRVLCSPQNDLIVRPRVEIIKDHLVGAFLGAHAKVSDVHCVPESTLHNNGG